MCVCVCALGAQRMGHTARVGFSIGNEFQKKKQRLNSVRIIIKSPKLCAAVPKNACIFQHENTSCPRPFKHESSRLMRRKRLFIE